MREDKRYLLPGRLGDVMALIQVLALDKHAHRSEAGLMNELQGNPLSSPSWTELATQHPEFFRVASDAKHGISLVARHVVDIDERGVRVLPSGYIQNLLSIAIELHDRQVKRKEMWRSGLVPILAAMTDGIFTIIGIALKVWFDSGTASR